MTAPTYWLRRGLAAAVVACFMVAWLVAPEGSAREGGPGADKSERVVLLFQQRMGEAETQDFLREYGLRRTATYMSVAGMTGVHRVLDAEASGASDTTPIDPRTASLEDFERGLQGNTFRLTQLIEEQPVNATVGPDLVEKLRGLLAVRAQLESALAILRLDRPFVYAVEIEDGQGRSAQAGRDSRVRGYQDAGTGDRHENRRAVRADSDLVTSFPKVLTGATADELHDMALKVLAGAP